MIVCLVAAATATVMGLASVHQGMRWVLEACCADTSEGIMREVLQTVDGVAIDSIVTQ